MIGRDEEVFIESVVFVLGAEVIWPVKTNLGADALVVIGKVGIQVEGGRLSFRGNWSGTVSERIVIGNGVGAVQEFSPSVAWYFNFSPGPVGFEEPE